MKKANQLAIVIALGIFGTLMSGPVSAQQVIGFDPQFGPICNGPLGPGPCAAVQQYIAMQQQQIPQHLQPNVIIDNVQNDVRNFDVRNPPNENNDLVGRKGWVRQRLGF